jgi:hypothetical protein
LLRTRLSMNKDMFVKTHEKGSGGDGISDMRVIEPFDQP